MLGKMQLISNKQIQGVFMINISQNNKKDCCGCTACASVCPKQCIKMTEDNEGFKYPKVDKSLCIDCNLCEKVCPIINNNSDTQKPTQAYILRNNDPDIVKVSTSGGAVTAISEVILSENGIVFGGAFDDNFDVCHRSAENAEDLKIFRSSKYVQSDLNDTYLQVKAQLESGRLVMFTGTPCQVEGLHHFLRKPYDNLFTVDFVCRAVPSPLVWRKYRKLMTEKYNSKITYANFREKTYGYHSANLTVRFENKKKSIENTKTDYMLKSFFDGICSRPSCYSCAFRKIKRVSDLTVFDCWNITHYVPTLTDDDKGYTAVIVQSEKGKEMIEKITDKTIRYVTDVDKLIAKDGFMALKNPTMHPKRDEYFDMLNKGVPLNKTVQALIPIKKSRKLLGKTRVLLHKLGLLNKLKKLK